LKPVPRIVTVIAPTGSGFGDTDVIFGPRLKMYALAKPTICLLTALVARTSTGFCPGTVVGAVYKPVEDIVPPLVTSDHVTALLDNPLTCAVKAIFLPTTTDGLVGETVTF
jgi:hypothetical protein